MPRHGSLRASDADREDVVARLHRAATEGRLAADELDERVAHALKAVTYDDLAATVIDLPSPRRPAPTRVAGGRRAPAGGWAVGVVRANPCLLVLVIPLVAVIGAMLIAVSVVWTMMLVVLALVGMRGRPPIGPWTLVLGRGRRGPRPDWY